MTHDQGYPLLGAKGNDMEERNLGTFTAYEGWKRSLQGPSVTHVLPCFHIPLVTRSLPSSGEARSLRDDTTGEGTDEGNERDMVGWERVQP